ncbi:hypothetical protein I2K64_003041 [Listeria monocytogenes]|nr:hypothetical protein [Listeria monocytogenes]
MRIIYFYDGNYQSNGENDLIFPDENGNYTIPENATDVEPEAGLYLPMTFDVEQQLWIGTSKEDWEAARPVTTPQPVKEYVTKEEYDKQRKELLAAQEAIAEIYESSLG